MRNRKVRPRFIDRWKEFGNPDAVTENLEHFVLPPVAAYHLTGQMEELEQFANLVHVTGRQHQLDPLLLQLIDDGKKEGYVRRIVDIDPDFVLRRLRLLGRMRDGFAQWPLRGRNLDLQACCFFRSFRSFDLAYQFRSPPGHLKRTTAT